MTEFEITDDSTVNYLDDLWNSERCHYGMTALPYHVHGELFAYIYGHESAAAASYVEHEIYVKVVNLTSHESTDVIINGRFAGFSLVHNSIVYVDGRTYVDYIENSTGNTPKSKIIMMNLETRQKEILFENNTEIITLISPEGYIVWVEKFPNESKSVFTYQLWSYNTENGDLTNKYMKKTTVAFFGDMEFRTKDSRVIGYGNDMGVIYFYDCTTDSLNETHFAFAFGREIDFYENKIATYGTMNCTVLDMSGNVLYAHDFSDMITSPGSHQIYSIYFYEDKLIFTNHPEGYSWLYSLTENKTLELREYVSEGLSPEQTTSHDWREGQIYPSIDDRHIVWIEFIAPSRNYFYYCICYCIAAIPFLVGALIVVRWKIGSVDHDYPTGDHYRGTASYPPMHSHQDRQTSEPRELDKGPPPHPVAEDLESNSDDGSEDRS